MHSVSKNSRRSAFTLIETIISISVMSVLFLGLSGAVVIGSKAIPSTVDTGEADQEIIDCLNRFRDELRQASQIKYSSDASGVKYDLTMVDSGATGAPSSITYKYSVDTQTVSRKADSNTESVYLTGVTDLQTSALLDDDRIRAVVMRFEFENSLQRHFETHIVLPNKPEAK